jgi:hypothetical protein
MSKFKFPLGIKAKDKITGFEGIILGRGDYLTGCNTYGLKPKVDKDGKIQNMEWFDEGTIKKSGEGISTKSVKADENDNTKSLGA